LAEKGDRRNALLQDKNVRRWFDNLARGSEITADVYLRRLGAFSDSNSTSPGELLKLPQKEIRNRLLDLVTEMQKAGKAGSYIKSNVKAVKSWLSFNEVEIKGKIKIEGADDTPSLKDERVPNKEELRKIFMMADPQQRVACSLVAHAGLRPESLGDYHGVDGLKVSDFPEMEIRPKKKEISFKKMPTVVIIRKNLSKGGHQYFSFLTAEASRYLKEYLEQRMRNGEGIRKESPVLTPKKDLTPRKLRDRT
jgi:hypothetical protein